MKRIIRKGFLAFSLGCISCIHADAPSESKSINVYPTNHDTDKYPQWFTGPIIAFTPITMNTLHPAIEPAVFCTWFYGRYNAQGNVVNIPTIFSIQPEVDFQFAINKIIGVEVYASFSSNFCKNAKSTHLNDTILNVGFQISNDNGKSWIPDFRIILEQIFPTGKYQHLSKDKFYTDLTGQGAFQTGLNLVFQKRFHLYKEHYLRLSGSGGYVFPMPVHAKGVSFYGGNETTKVKVYPGSYFNGYFVTEYSFSRTWGLTIEMNYFQEKAGRKAKPHLNSDVLVPSRREFSIAPEIQHTFSPQLGIIVGSWFSVLGKNTVAFASGFVAVLYVF